MGGVHYTPLANQIKTNQNNGGFTLNIGNQQSTGERITNQLIGGIFDIAGLALTAAFTAKANGTQQSQSTQQQAEQNIEMTPDQLQTLKNTELQTRSDIQSQLNALNKLILNPNDDGNSYKTQIQELNINDYMQYKAQQDTANTNIERLDTQKDVDMAEIKGLQSTIENSISTLNTLNSQILGSVKEGDVTINFTEGQDCMTAYRQAQNNYPSPEYPAKESYNNDQAWEAAKVEYDKADQRHKSYLALESKCQEQDNLRQQQKEATEQQTNAQERIKELKKTYGDDLTGQTSGSYKKEREENINKLNQANEYLSRNSGSKTSYRKAQEITLEQSYFEGFKSQYTTTTTSKDNDGNETTTTTLKKAEMQQTQQKLQQALQLSKQITIRLNTIEDLQKEVERINSNIGKLDKADGNLFSRGVLTGWLVKGSAKAQRADKNRKDDAKEMLATKQTQLQAQTRQLIAELGQRDALISLQTQTTT